jgi:hypothetical protein
VTSAASWTVTSWALVHEVGDRVDVIRLSCITRHAIGARESASQAAVNDHQSFAGPVVHALRTHQATAIRSAILWPDIDVLRPQARRAVIAVTAISQRRHYSAAVLADEGLILGRPADGSASRLKK